MPDSASSGHRLGQLVGDWFERHFVWPLLGNVARPLELFLDTRFASRTARGEKLCWDDGDGNSVDYDFVLELGGTRMRKGVPVGFVECFWRRGARHSKDKARDDSGKLVPMRENYPTARFLGIVAAGEFTSPARSLVMGRGIDLLYIPKDRVVDAFRSNGLVMDYPDSASEAAKGRIADEFASALTPRKKSSVARSLRTALGNAVIDGYTDRVRSKLSALPQELRFKLRRDSQPVVFESISEASRFLREPSFDLSNPAETYLYEITYSDGSEYSSHVTSNADLKALHEMTVKLSAHMERLSRKRSAR